MQAEDADAGSTFAFKLSWNELVDALTFINSSESQTMPAGVAAEAVEGHVYHRGSPVVGGPFGSWPVAFVQSFYVEQQVSGFMRSFKQ